MEVVQRPPCYKFFLTFFNNSIHKKSNTDIVLGIYIKMLLQPIINTKRLWHPYFINHGEEGKAGSKLDFGMFGISESRFRGRFITPFFQGM